MGDFPVGTTHIKCDATKIARPVSLCTGGTGIPGGGREAGGGVKDPRPIRCRGGRPVPWVPGGGYLKIRGVFKKAALRNKVSEEDHE